MPFPYIFTFYSYKGGVGRSMAVMNVAYTLAGWGRHVLIVDMDLEAPGLSGFLHRSGELAEPDAAHPKDILSLLGEAANALRAGSTQSLPPVSNYVRAVAGERLKALAPRLGQLGRLDVIGPDMARDYLGRFARLGLKDLYQSELIALSRLLHHYFKAQTFLHRPLGVEPFEPPLDTPYDYVLVDSRAGITEFGGLCVGPLADRLVVITGLNDQNVQGTLAFLNEAGIETTPRRPSDRPWDDADAVSVNRAGSATLGPKPTIIVASPVPVGEIGYKRERLGEIEKLLGIRPISLFYHPQMALMESVFVRDYPDEPLASEYRRLANLVLTQVRDDAQRRASDARELWKEQKALDAGTIQAALRLASHEPEMFNALIGHLEQEGAISAVDSVPAMRQLYAYLSHDADIGLSALNNWAIALADQGKTMQGIEADRFFAAATQKYAEVLRLKPDDPVALNNWGAALLDRSKKKEGQQADRLIEEAFLKITGALRLKPDYVDALINFGNALFRQASLKTGEQADRLYEEAGQKYAEALTLKPDHPQALNNWANALVSRAKAKQGAESGRLFESACRKYYEALRLKPDFHDALNNLSTALLNQARTEPAAEAERLRLRAREKSLLAEKIRPGSGAYNLACVEALDGNAAEAIRWLQTAQSTGKLLSRAIIAADRDFDRVRNDSGFVSFVESLPEN